MKEAIDLIGAPTDVGASILGASMGPEALRVAGLQQALQRHGLAVHDAANLAGPPNPSNAALAGLRHLDEVVQWNREVYQAVLASCRNDRSPF